MAGGAGEVADHPVLGVGVDNFAVDFVRERSTGEEPLYPHSLALRTFSQTGLIGGALFLGFVAAALAAALPRRKEPDSLSAAVAAAALASGVYWLVHGSIDWLWEIPALGASALALLGLASGLARSTPREAVRIRGRSAALLAGAGALFALAAGSFALPGLAAIELERGVRAWPDSPDRALSYLERAHGLNPLSERADVVAGTLAWRDGDTEQARAAFQRALERNPHDWYVHLQLALLAEEGGRSADALVHLERARSLNPREPARARDDARGQPRFAGRSRAAGSAAGRLRASPRTGKPVRRGRRLNEMYAPARDPIAARRSLGALAATTACLLLAVVVSLVLSRYPPTLELATAAGLGLVAILALALIRQEAAAALGFALLGVVIVEPAPADLVFFVVIAIALATGSFRIQRVPAAAVGIVGVFFALNLVSAIEVVDYERAVTFFATTAYVAVLALWLAGWVTNRRRAKVAAGGYVAAATLSASLGLLALFLPLPGGDLMVFEDRVQALFKDPNVFGPFLVPAVLILMEETITPRLFGFGRVLKGLLLLLLTLGLIFSYSRGAWANLAIGVGMVLLVMAMRRGGGRKVLVALVLTLVAGALVAGAVSLSGSGDFLADRARVQSYDADRFGAQAAGLEPAQRYPFGVGPGQFELVAPISAHSTYVRVFAEQGLPGIMAFVALLIFTLGAAFANAVAGRDTYGIGSAALLGAWCGILVNSFVIDTLHWRHLWVVAALIWAGWARRRVGPSRVSKPLAAETT